MFKTLVVLGLSVSTALALDAFPIFNKRQSVPVPCSQLGLKGCADAYSCIPLDYTCCPDRSGGCPAASSYCSLGSNGQYSCCPRGTVCSGPGGVNSEQFTLTATLTGEVETSTSTAPIKSTSTFVASDNNAASTPAGTATSLTAVPDTTTASILEPSKTEAISSSESGSAGTLTTTTTFAPPTSSPNGTSTQPPPVTANSAIGYSTSFVKAIAAMVAALVAI